MLALRQIEAKSAALGASLWREGRSL